MKPIRKNIRALAMDGQPHVIKYLLIHTFYDLCEVEFVYDNNSKLDRYLFIDVNRKFIRNYPKMFQEIFAIPSDIDRDVLAFIMKDAILSHMFLNYPARIYQYRKFNY